MFVYKIKSNGERTHPWGDLVDEEQESDKLPFTLTLCDLFDKKSKIFPPD